MTIHATWTELLPAGELAAGGETEIGGRRLRVVRVAELHAVVDAEFEADGAQVSGRVIRRPRSTSG